MNLTLEGLAKVMKNIAKNSPRVKKLREQMKDEETRFTDKALAFTEIFCLMDGDPFAQRRLVREFKAEAEKQKQKEIAKSFEGLPRGRGTGC